MRSGTLLFVVRCLYRFVVVVAVLVVVGLETLECFFHCLRIFRMEKKRRRMARKSEPDDWTAVNLGAMDGRNGRTNESQRDATFRMSPSSKSSLFICLLVRGFDVSWSPSNFFYTAARKAFEHLPMAKHEQHKSKSNNNNGRRQNKTKQP
jgi:hypothetical protein